MGKMTAEEMLKMTEELKRKEEEPNNERQDKEEPR